MLSDESKERIEEYRKLVEENKTIGKDESLTFTEKLEKQGVIAKKQLSLIRKAVSREEVVELRKLNNK